MFIWFMNTGMSPLSVPALGVTRFTTSWQSSTSTSGSVCEDCDKTFDRLDKFQAHRRSHEAMKKRML